MVREIRNSRRILSAEMTEELLKKSEYGVLATISEDGTPYGVPMSYVFQDGVIYMHCALEGHKLENLTANENVCFTVVDHTEVLPEKFSTKYQSAIVFGKAQLVEEREEKLHGILSLADKYSHAYQKEGAAYAERAFEKFKVIKLIPERITGKGRLD